MPGIEAKIWLFNGRVLVAKTRLNQNVRDVGEERRRWLTNIGLLYHCIRRQNSRLSVVRIHFVYCLFPAFVGFMSNKPSPDPAASRQNSDHSSTEVRAANADDLPELVALIDDFVTANRLLPRTLDELKDLIPSGFVAIWQDRLVGFAALEVYSPKLGEVRSLAVRPEAQGLGLGKQLVEMCVNLAKSRNVLEVMAVTSNETFFQACGFDFTLPGEKKALFLQTREDVEIPRDSNHVNS